MTWQAGLNVKMNKSFYCHKSSGPHVLSLDLHLIERKGSWVLKMWQALTDVAPQVFAKSSYVKPVIFDVFTEIYLYTVFLYFFLPY